MEEVYLQLVLWECLWLMLILQPAKTVRGPFFSFSPLVEQFAAGNSAMAVMTSAGRHSRRYYRLRRKEGLPDGRYQLWPLRRRLVRHS